jgi:hypothetical protein
VSPCGYEHQITPGMTQRKQRAIEIALREAELRDRQSEFDRKRARTAGERGQRRLSDAERQMRAEMSALTGERKILLEQVIRREAELRRRQGDRDRARAAAANRGKELPVTKAEEALQAELAVLASERAHLDGTVQRARRDAAIQDLLG